ncbi:MAG: hypothetical protein FJX76_27475 [Armatimonadetes bacterium]|nr:hypothetical protein [Armatimonadota bacterium]
MRGVARAVGVTASNSDTVASGAKGIILATGAAFGMAASASLPALPLGFIGGAGGAASAWVAVREGARGLAEGVTFGFQAADALTAPAVAR